MSLNHIFKKEVFLQLWSVRASVRTRQLGLFVNFGRSELTYRVQTFRDHSCFDVFIKNLFLQIHQIHFKGLPPPYTLTVRYTRDFMELTLLSFMGYCRVVKNKVFLQLGSVRPSVRDS